MITTQEQPADFKIKSDDDIILHYIHKKFRSNDLHTKDTVEDGGVIRGVKIRNSPGSSVGTMAERKSVIVRREDARTELEIEFEMQSRSNQTDQIKISLNVEQLEILFTMEEENFFHKSLDQFTYIMKSIPQEWLDIFYFEVGEA